ncbi:copper resistance CopC family protein [Paractinoplanes maris]|uniref:copper resistance CopC family protein n=1 Tax=Paractinoplanes maris TaxID=1734446 RepID=UPI0020208CF3|nr:copper resistance CopC family protein [Actinoplanes maris]
MSHRRPVRFLLAAAAFLAVLLPGVPAWAHAQLVAAAPTRDATLTTAPTEVTLTFNEQLNPDFTTIVLSDAARQRLAASAPQVSGPTGTIRLSTPPTNGDYTVAYRVVSTDGHTVQGSYEFTVADPSRPAPVASAPIAEPTAPPTPADGLPAGAFIALGAVGVALAGTAAYFTLAGRRRGSPPESR